MESAAVSDAGNDLQVRFLDSPVLATTIQIRIGGRVAGEALVLTHDKDTFLLVTMMWRRELDADGPESESGVAEHKRRVCEALVQEAVALATRQGAGLIAIVGAPDDLIARGFDENGSMWRLPAPAHRTTEGK